MNIGLPDNRALLMISIILMAILKKLRNTNLKILLNVDGQMIKVSEKIGKATMDRLSSKSHVVTVKKKQCSFNFNKHIVLLA